MWNSTAIDVAWGKRSIALMDEREPSESKNIYGYLQTQMSLRPASATFMLVPHADSIVYEIANLTLAAQERDSKTRQEVPLATNCISKTQDRVIQNGGQSGCRPSG